MLFACLFVHVTAEKAHTAQTLELYTRNQTSRMSAENSVLLLKESVVIKPKFNLFY